MTDSKPRVGAGDIAIELDGDALVLKPTVGAIQAISRTAGGLQKAAQEVLFGNFDMVCLVIGAGLGYVQGSKDYKALPEKIFRTGLTDDSGGLIAKSIDYLNCLQNGGRRWEPPADDGEASEDENPPSSG